MLDVVTLGEPMVQLNAVTTGPLRHVQYFERHVAGAEANVAVAVARMGLRAGLITRVGVDEFGACIMTSLKGEGVDVSQIRADRRSFTGVYFVQRGYPVPGKSRSAYYRKGSAASKLGPDDVTREYISSSKLLYLTGITPALSQSCLLACAKAMETAKQAGLKVAFDTNIRPILWSDGDPKKALLPLVRKSDIVFTDAADARFLMGENNRAEIARRLLSWGVSTVVVKGGAGKTFAYSGKDVYSQRALDVPVVDPTGAGDAFAGVFVSGYLKGWDLRKCLAAAEFAGSMVVTTRGDQENIPTEQDVLEYLKSAST